MAYGYVIKKGREFRFEGKRFRTGDPMITGDLAAKLEKEENGHLLHHLIRVAVADPIKPSVVAAPAG